MSASGPPRPAAPAVAAEPVPATVNPGKERWAKLIVWVYAVACVLSVVLWVAHLLRPSLAYWPTMVLGALNIPVSPSLVSVVVLVLLTGALLRRKRVALVIVALFELAGLLISTGILAWVWGFDLELAPNPPLASVDVALEVLGVVVAVAALWLSWWVREAFPAAPGPAPAWLPP